VGHHQDVDRPPEEIELAGVAARLRRSRASDADAVQEAIEESRDHLRPFMVWADQSKADTATFLAGGEERWDAGEEFGYLIVDDGDGSVLGGGGLHRRSTPDTIEIGYWRRVNAGGRGLVTALARALTAAGFDLDGVERVEIHCDVANTASADVPRRLGYQLAGVIDKPPQAPAETGRHQVWVTAAPD
jgi:RimJ/RimL family protein N-acetyltransferase